MWHEARKQEKKIRGMMVDFKKRAERRREYYETIKLDPAQFLQIHGRVCKIHLDPSVYHAAESPATMMPWQGQKTNMIDRFDVRAHLDIIPEYSGIGHLLLSPEEDKEERKCNYERYRVLVQNDYAGNTEEQCLQQIYIDEMFPELQNKNEEDKSKKLLTKKAAIGFSYDDSTPAAGETNKEGDGENTDEDDDTDDSLSDLEIDNVNIDVEELTSEQEVFVNQVGEKYGLASKQFTQLLRKEKEEAEDLKRAKAEEEERAMYSGRKSRRERRAYIEKRLRQKKIPSPPSYARRDSPTYDPYPSNRRRSSSGSRSSTPEGVGKVTFITSFGGEEDVTKNEEKKNSVSKDNSETHSKVWKRSRWSSSSSSSSASPSRSHDNRRRSRSSSESRSRSQSRSRSRSPKRTGKYFRDRYRSSSSSSSESDRPQGKRFYDRGRLLSPPHSKRSRSRSHERSSRGRGHHGRSSSDSSSSRSRSRSVEPVTPTQVLKLKKETPKPKNLPASTTKTNLTAKDRMKIMMQRALNKQHKTDKKKEVLKKEEKLQEQISREDDLRERARQMRRLERERREREWEEEHGHRRDSDDSYERRRRRRESRSSPIRRRSRSKSRSRSRSHSPRSHHHRHHHHHHHHHRDYR